MDEVAIASPSVRLRQQPLEVRSAIVVLAYSALAVLLAFPMLVATVPLGADDLNHLARIYVRAHIGADPDLSRLFEVKTALIPYLGMDLMLTPLARQLPVLFVGRMYVAALVWGLVAAVIALQRVFTSRVGLGPAFAGLIAYNGLLAWGLLNYLLGLILALLAFSAWHALRQNAWLTRLILSTAAATGLYLTHLLAFALYGILIVSYELLARPQPWRTPMWDWLILVVQAFPALALWATQTGGAPSGDYAAHYFALAKMLELESPFLFRGAVGGLDTGSAVLIAYAALLVVGTRRGWLMCPRTLAAPAMVLLVLGIVAPFRVFGVALIDHRFQLAVACLALAGLRLLPQARFHVVAIGAIAILLVAIRVVDVSLLMQRCDGQYAELRGAFAALPRGAELTTVLERTAPVPGAACTALPIYNHMPQLITIDRSGYAPDFFAHVQSVAVRDGRVSDTDPIAADSFTTAPTSGYVLWIHLGHRRPAPSGLVLVHRGSFFDIWEPQVTPVPSPPPPDLPALSAPASSPSG